MQALSDDQQIERLEGRMDRFEGRMDRFEKKMDDGFAALRGEIKEVRGEMDDGLAAVRGEIKEVRSEARADHRMLIGVQLTTTVAMALGFAGIILQQFLS